MPKKRSPFDLMLFFRECNKEHTQKIIRSLMASDRSAWKGSRKPEVLRRLSSLVFAPSPSPTLPKSPARPSRGLPAKVASAAPPLRLGGRYDHRTALDAPDAPPSRGGARSRAKNAAQDAESSVKDVSMRDTPGPTGTKPGRAARRPRPGLPR